MISPESLHLSLETVKEQIDELDEIILSLTRRRAALVVLINFLDGFPEFNTEHDNG